MAGGAPAPGTHLPPASQGSHRALGRQGCVSQQLWGSQLPAKAQAGGSRPELVGSGSLSVPVGGSLFSWISASGPQKPSPLSPDNPLQLC